MKKYSKHIALILAICMCAMLLTACGTDVNGIAKDIMKTANDSKSFSISYDFNILGSVNSANVDLSGRYAREQSESSGNIYESFNNQCKIGEAHGREYLSRFLIDGVYYCEDDATYLCQEAVVDFHTVPGEKFWQTFISAEKQELNEENFSCKVVLSGDDLKELIKEFTYNIYTEIASVAQWNTMEGEVDLDLSEEGYVEKMTVSCPALGEVILKTFDESATVSCTDCDINIYLTYTDPEVTKPTGIDSATNTSTVHFAGINALYKGIMDTYIELQEIEKEKEAAKNFVAVELKGEGSVTMTAAGKTAVLTFPSKMGIYSSLTQNEPGIVLLTHDIFKHLSGRTIVHFCRGTAESFYNSLNLDISAAQDVEINGYKGKLITQKSTEQNYFGKTVCEENYYFVTEMDKVILALRIEASYGQEHAGVINDNIVSDILSHITLN